MGMTAEDNNVLTHSANARTRKEAKEARADASRYFEKKENERYRATIADLGAQARGVRATYKQRRTEAKGTCKANLDQTKEANKDKRPYRRRAEVAKAKSECAFDVMNVEEQTASALEAIEGQRDAEVTQRRSSKVAAGHNRARAKERQGRSTARERREEMFDQVRNDLDPGVLPYFEEIKGTAAFKKLLDGGRMTATEAVMQMAHEDPEAVFAALERSIEQELQREIERFEYEGGRLAAGQDPSPVQPEEQPENEPPIEEPPPEKKSRARRAPKDNTKAKGRARRTKGNDASPVRAASTEHDEHERQIERYEDEGGRLDETAPREIEPSQPEPDRTERHAVHEQSAEQTPHAASPHHGASCACELRRSHAEQAGTPDAAAEHTASSHAPATSPHVAPTTREEMSPHATSPSSDATPARRLSPEQRTGWIPGTEPERPAPPAEPVAPARRNLFDDDTLPETPDAKREHEKRSETSSAHGKSDPNVQQTFGTNFQSWLAQAGSQLTLDAAPVAPAPRAASSPIVVAPPAPRHAPHSIAPEPSGTSATIPHAPPEVPPPAALDAGADEPEQPPRFSSREYDGGRLYVDRGTNVVQVGFDDMPAHEIRAVLRQGGFRWSPGIQRWQAPLDDAHQRLAEQALIEHANAVDARRARRGKRERANAPNASASLPSESAESADHSAIASPADGTLDARQDDVDEDGERDRNSYEERRAARVERLHARADALQAEANAAYNNATTKAERIPFGQPILVGHHSEGRDRRFRARIDADFSKAFELQNEANELRRRAARAEKNGAISSDDPDAIAKLQAKVQELDRQIDRARDINEIIRAARASRKSGWEPIAQRNLVAFGIPSEQATKLVQKDFAGRIGVPGHVTRNAAGEIARLNHRIDELKRRDARPVQAPQHIGEATITEDRDANRVQIRFEGIPSKELRSALRAHGFVWAPSVGAWQRKLNDNASWAAKQVLRDHYSPQVSESPPAPPREPGDDGDDDSAPVAPAPQHAPDANGEGPVPF